MRPYGDFALPPSSVNLLLLPPTLALILLALPFAALGLALARLSPRWRVLPRAALATAALTYLLGQAFVWENQLIWARPLPTPNAIIYSNLSVLAAALLAGLLLAFKKLPRYRRIPLAALLFALGLYQTAYPLFAPRPTLGPDHWQDNVSRQSTQATCSASAAATLLRAHNIPATESEMAALCLTTSKGTLSLGRYRGLLLKTQNTPFAVKTFTGPYATFRQTLPKNTPAILSLGLRKNAAIDPHYERTWGWTPGMRHTIVLFKHLPNGDVEVGDPSLGRDRWPEKTLEDLWYGEALWLERR